MFPFPQALQCLVVAVAGWINQQQRDVIDYRQEENRVLRGCFRHQLLLPRPYLVLTKPLRLDIQCQRGASVKIGWKYLDD